MVFLFVVLELLRGVSDTCNFFFLSHVSHEKLHFNWLCGGGLFRREKKFWTRDVCSHDRIEQTKSFYSIITIHPEKIVHACALRTYALPPHSKTHIFPITDACSSLPNTNVCNYTQGCLRCRLQLEFSVQRKTEIKGGFTALCMCNVSLSVHEYFEWECVGSIWWWIKGIWTATTTMNRKTVKNHGCMGT